MKSIPLSQGKFALVDDDDYEWISKKKWYFRGNGYAAHRGVLMHRAILKTPKGMSTDHIDGNKLNNQKSNLRICTHTENIQNSKRNSGNVSGYKGVSQDKARGRWRAYIKSNKRMIHLGYFLTAEDAAHAYDEAARKYHGEFARTNF